MRFERAAKFVRSAGGRSLLGHLAWGAVALAVAVPLAYWFGSGSPTAMVNPDLLESVWSQSAQNPAVLELPPESLTPLIAILDGPDFEASRLGSIRLWKVTRAFANPAEASLPAQQFRNLAQGMGWVVRDEPDRQTAHAPDGGVGMSLLGKDDGSLELTVWIDDAFSGGQYYSMFEALELPVPPPDALTQTFGATDSGNVVGFYTMFPPGYLFDEYFKEMVGLGWRPIDGFPAAPVAPGNEALVQFFQRGNRVASLQVTAAAAGGSTLNLVLI